MPRVRIEFYGLARLRAGRSAIEATAATLGEALAAADATCPQLRACRAERIAPEYLLSVAGKRFTSDLSESCEDGESLLILGADAGG